MKCVEWEERVALYAGGDLVTVEVEQHLAECAVCREFCDSLRDCMETLREEHRTGIDAAHYTAVRTRVLAEIRRERSVWRRLAWVSGVGVAAAALLAGVLVRPGPLPAPPPRAALNIPAAELVRHVETPAVSRPLVARAQRAPKNREPIVVKLQTADPNIVIYWIAD